MNRDGSIAGSGYEEGVLFHEHQRSDVALVGLSLALRVLVVLQLQVIDVIENLYQGEGRRSRAAF